MQPRNRYACIERGAIVGYVEWNHRFAPHYFCPTCGEVWGKIVPLSGDPEWHASYPRFCPEHWDGNLHQFPTLMLSETDECSYDYEVLLRDFWFLVQAFQYGE